MTLKSLKKSIYMHKSSKECYNNYKTKNKYHKN